MSFLFTRLTAALAAVLLCSTGAAANTTAAASSHDASGTSPEQAERLGLEARRSDPAAAAKHFEIAAAGGRPLAQWLLARMYWDGVGLAKDAERALHWFRAAAAQGVAGAQSFLGWAYLPSAGAGLAPDPQQAFRWFSAAAKQEDPYALLMLADFFGRGVVVAQDRDRAKRLLVRAAQLGELNACRFASTLLLYGPPEQRDAPLGMHFLTKTAKSNDPKGAYLLAREYLRGTRVARDFDAAARWMTRAFEAKHTPAALWLSELHFKGLGVSLDPARGEEILAQALAAATISDRNNFAWELAVGEDSRLRDAALAIRVLEPALTAAAEKSASHLDTLAAAYAAAGEFDKAIATQLAAIEALRRSDPTSEDLKGMESRLELFRSGAPYREEI